MADGGVPFALRVLDSLNEVDAEDWDALAGEDDPFSEHAFLRALEASGSVGPGSGWLTRHVTIWDGESLIAAMPLYLKGHSYGEFIFDWAWSSAAARAGLPYYPKLVSMIPFTPATGRRLLLSEDYEPAMLVRRLLDGALELREAHDASSVHLLFLASKEADLVAEDGRFLRRLTHQFHWRDEGYDGFDDFVGRFRASMRKKLKKERRAVERSHLDIRTLAGDELTKEHFEALRRFYRDTCDRKGSYPYLTNRFFEIASEELRHRAVAVMAFDGERPVAGTLNFEKGRHLYGRYWGCVDDHDMLHFELCYYRLIERAIERGMQRFEAGAQGTQKLRRGLMPARIHSFHYIEHPGLRRAVAEFLPREAMMVEREIEELAEHGPFRRGGG